ncbi:MAG: mercury resistance system periplasmic binding protein MerP [Xanthomonadaceae bacterium]|nr:mercury resistance system periplasmic binding protein MerP [Xanthomonadaceae bacterium]MDE2278178.1 mercury resistance system periplasmic binding protein MerP [Xanthomonadaceae bacterium]MDE2316554.1 mercury resistance system periplasmic binding protein MerP [Xanthomonadaceae bacterium]
MKKSFPMLALGVLLAAAFSAPVWAATQTVTLAVPGMTCPVCPITVNKALTRVAGVDKVDVNFEQRAVTVAFDDTKTNVNALIAATTNAGYPSSVKQKP